MDSRRVWKSGREFFFGHFFLFSFSRGLFVFTCSLESKEPLDSKEPVFIFTSAMKKTL